MSMLNDEQSHQQDLHEQKLLEEATPIVKDFERVRILEQMCDQQSIVVAETLLVTRKNKPNLRYALRIVELRSEPALRAALHEIEILKKLGQHQSIMGLFLAFRHRQYVGLLQPAFFSLRDRIDLTYRFKKSQGDYRIFFRDPNTSRPLAEAFSNKRSLTCLKKIGVFERNSVVYILREILLALDFLNAKNYVHTQICSSSVFVNERCAVKLGSLLHCRRIGSKNWQFTGNPNRLPPEAFFDQTFVDKDPQLRIKPDFDTWAMGLLALEMVTGKRMRYSRDEMQELAIKFRNYTEQPPTLEETDPKTVVDGKQVYDPDITNFLAQCFVVDHIKRKNPARFRNHPFLSRPINADEGKVWIAVEPRDESPWNTGRSLYIDMLTVHSYYAQIKEDLMSTLSVAIKLIRDGKCFPIFDENLGEGLVRGKYVAVDASLAFVLEEEHDWSRDVLNVSNASTPGKVAMPVLEASKTPDVSGEQIRRGKGTGLAQHHNKDCQRVELIFFVNRDWSVVNRRLYISLQFVRWFVRELITFADLIRVVDELDDILIDYMISHEPRPFSPYKNKQRTCPPDSVAFVTGLRRSLIDPQSNDDPETHRFNNIYIDVALKPELVRKKKAKLDRLRQGDAVAYPNMMGPLWASATFYDLNMDRLNRLEAMLLGQKRIEEWDFDANVKEEDTKESAQENELTTLLKMRRKNPNLAVSSDIEPALSNEARRAKLWGDYTRDFMYRVAKYAVPYQLDNKMARKLYGSPSPTMMSVERLSGPSFDDIDIQLARTRSKQEEDTAETFKIHDDPEQREAMVRRQLREKDEQIRNLEEQMQQLMMGTSQQQGMAPQSPAPPRMEEVDDDLSRLPKHNPKI